MKRKEGPIEPDYAKKKFEELRPFVESVLKMNLDGFFLKQLDILLEWTDAELGKEVPQSPVLAFDIVRRIINNRHSFERMRQYLSEAEEKDLRRMRNALNRLDGICRQIKWPKPLQQ